MSNKKKKRVKKSKSSSKVIKFPVIKIIWDDHFSGNRGWVYEAKDLRTYPYVCTTVGILVDEDEKTITLAQNMGENYAIADTTTVIKSCIVGKRETLGYITYGKKG